MEVAAIAQVGRRAHAAFDNVGAGGATNAITYSTDLLGDITLIGPGAGRIETGYAIIGDILSFSR